MLDETLLAAITANTGDPRRPLLFHNTTIHTADPVIGDLAGADLLLAGDVIVGLGPDLHAAAVDDDPIVVDGTGLTIVPWIIRGAADAGSHAHPADRVGVLQPGSPATFAVLPGRSSGAGLEMVVWRPEQAAVLVVDGEVTLFDGRPLTPTPTEPLRSQSVRNPYLGMWIDESGYIHQELAADGRYDETRGGRPHAYQGAFWIEGDWIVYRDDLGFWAYGRFNDGVLHHAGYTFHRRDERDDPERTAHQYLWRNQQSLQAQTA